MKKMAAVGFSALVLLLSSLAPAAEVVVIEGQNLVLMSLPTAQEVDRVLKSELSREQKAQQIRDAMSREATSSSSSEPSFCELATETYGTSVSLAKCLRALTAEEMVEGSVDSNAEYKDVAELRQILSMVASMLIQGPF